MLVIYTIVIIVISGFILKKYMLITRPYKLLHHTNYHIIQFVNIPNPES